jgi:hypothetical protein
MAEVSGALGVEVCLSRRSPTAPRRHCGGGKTCVTGGNCSSKHGVGENGVRVLLILVFASSAVKSARPLARILRET